MPRREFAKNNKETIRVTPEQYEGHDLVDIRVYARDKSGDIIPTRKGIAINVDTVPELIEALTWSMGQACNATTDDSERRLSPSEADQLAQIAWQSLRKHGSGVHWDTAERIVLSENDGFSKWDLHYVLATRPDLFERTGRACYRARVAPITR